MAKAAASPMAKTTKTATVTRAKSESGQGEFDRSLGRAVAIALPAATIVAAIIVGIFSSLAPALLIMAGGALLGTVVLLWASVRTLTGDAPLSEGLEVAARSREEADDLAEQKVAVLRALKDVEHEHAIGKMDDEDFRELSMRYREQAKKILREMDAKVAPFRAQAEKLAREHVAKLGSRKNRKAITEESSVEADERPAATMVCIACSGANDVDARFCKHCGAPLAEKAEKKDASA